MKKKVISISGNIAVGKTEVSRLLGQAINMEVYKASSVFREEARKKNMSLIEFNEYIKTKPEIDNMIEAITKNIIETKNNIIIDARLGFYIAPNSFKVYIVASKEIAARRLYKDSVNRGSEETYDSYEEALLGILKREKFEEKRWKKLYNVNIHDTNNYDLIVDSTDKTPIEVVDIIIAKYNEWLRQDKD